MIFVINLSYSRLSNLEFIITIWDEGSRTIAHRTIAHLLYQTNLSIIRTKYFNRWASIRWAIVRARIYSPFTPNWNGFDFKPVSQSNYHLLKPIIKPIITVRAIEIETVPTWSGWTIYPTLNYMLKLLLKAKAFFLCNWFEKTITIL